MAHTALVMELLLLFFALPLLLLRLRTRLILPALWLGTAGTLPWLLHEPGFHSQWLWNQAGLRTALPSMLLLFILAAALLMGLVRVRAPEKLWQLPRQNPRLWLLVLVAYPVLSVYPQELLYRGFFFARYAPLFPAASMMVAASAVTFGFAHILFRNRTAVVLATVGGVIFGVRYLASGSLAACSLEHALYGGWIFTVGLGESFYHGTMGTVRGLSKTEQARKDSSAQEI